MRNMNMDLVFLKSFDSVIYLLYLESLYLIYYLNKPQLNQKLLNLYIEKGY